MIGEWLDELSGSDVAGLVIAGSAIVTSLIGLLSAREARLMSTKPLESAERLMKATEQVNARATTSMDTLANALVTHLVELKVSSASNTAKIDEIVRRVSRRRK